MSSRVRSFFASVGALALAMGLVLLACSSFGTDDGAQNADTSAGNDGPGVGRPFCDGPSPLCADFDDPMSDVWDDISVFDGGTLVVSDGAAVSFPSALRAVVQPPAPDAGCRYALRYREFDVAAPSGLKLEYAILPGGPGGRFPRNVSIGASVKATDSLERSCEYYLNVSDSVASLVVEPMGDGGDSTSFKLFKKLTGGAWNAVTIELLGGPGSSRAVRVAVNGEPALQPTMVPLFCRDAVRATELQVGLFCIGDDFGGNVEAWFDNVRVTIP